MLITAISAGQGEGGQGMNGDSHISSCGFVSPTMTSTSIALMPQAALLLVSVSGSPPAACPSGSIAEYQSVLTWHRSSAAVY